MSANSRLFDSIGYQIKSFIDLNGDYGTYNLDRMATVNVKSGNVKWSLENKLMENKGSGNSISSELRVAKDFNDGLETLSLITSNDDNPTFSIESNRFNYYSNITGQLKFPKYKLGLYRNYHPKYSFDITDEINHNTGKIGCDIGFAYQYSNAIIFGAKSKMYGEKTAFKGMVNYSAAVEYNPDPTKMFYGSLNGVQPNDYGEEQKGSMSFSVGAGIKKDFGTLYGEACYDITLGSYDVGIGLNRELGGNNDSDISVVARTNKKVNILYSNDLNGVNASIKAGCNFDLNGKSSGIARMQWKVTFGDSFTKDDFGALGDAQKEL